MKGDGPRQPKKRGGPRGDCGCSECKTERKGDMNNLIFFPSYRYSEHGLLYGGRVWGGSDEIREAVSDRDWRRLWQRFCSKRCSELRGRWGGFYPGDNWAEEQQQTSSQPPAVVRDDRQRPTASGCGSGRSRGLPKGERCCGVRLPSLGLIG